MDESEHIMTERDASEFHKLCLKHLKAYVWLHQHGMNCDRRVPGRRCWLLLPKLHHLWHLAWDTLQTKLNPRMSQLLSAESFVGEIGRIAKATHRSNLSQRTLERYLAKLSLKVDEIVKKWWILRIWTLPQTLKHLWAPTPWKKKGRTIIELEPNRKLDWSPLPHQASGPQAPHIFNPEGSVLHEGPIPIGILWVYLIIRYMDIIWMSRLGLGSGDFGVTSCQINVSKLLLLWLHRPSVWVLLVELCQADLHDLVGHLWNHESTLSTRQVIWLTKTPWTFTFLIHSHQMSQPTSSVLTSFYLFQWLVVHVQSFSRLFLEVPLVVAPGGSWDNPFEEDQKGPSLTWANLQFFPPVGSSELENINDTFGASCQWIFGLLSLVESLHP